MAPLTDPVPGRSRLGLTLRELVRRWRDLPRMFAARGWAEQTIIVGVMQNHDNSLTTYTEPRRFGRGRTMVTKQGIGSPSPTFLPEANMVGRHVARIIDGIPSAGWNDALERPISGHFLGGCAIAETPERGVVDPYHRLHGYPGLHVIDGSNIAANLGVNPSLTIVAMAERAASMWPNKQDDDPRPGAGEPYRPIDPVPPRRPSVPSTAPGALWTLAKGQARHDEERRR
jgi:cholesterol oxidase